MSLGAVLLLLAQSAAADAAPPERQSAGEGRQPVAIASARATARIIRPITVRIERRGEKIAVEAQAEHRPQTSQDAAGTVWIEFS